MRRLIIRRVGIPTIAALGLAACVAATSPASPGTTGAGRTTPGDRSDQTSSGTDELTYVAGTYSARNLFRLTLGREAKRLTRAGRFDAAPQWSPDGKWIVFTRYTSFDPPRGRLFVVGRDGAGLRRLTSGSKADINPDWSPDGSQIAFVRYPYRPPGAKQDYAKILKIPFDGGDEVELAPADSQNNDPQWAPDGETIVYESSAEDENPPDDQGSRSDVWIMDANGADKRNVTAAMSGTSPRWSPDGSSLLYERFGETSSDLWVGDVDGVAHRPLTSGCGYKESPDWSPDGRLVAYQHDYEGCGGVPEDESRQDIKIVDALTGQQVDAITRFGVAGKPRWSPDGSALAFTAMRRGQFDLFVYEVEEKDLRRVTRTRVDEDSPAWRP